MKPLQIKKLILSSAFSFLALQSATNAAWAVHVHDRPDSHAPIGVMGDHLMEQGQWMASYRLMNMHMDGMRSGTDDITPQEVALLPNALAGESMRMGNLPDGSPRIMTVPPTYRIAPLEMDMRMHMLGLMYGLSHDVTAMVMFNTSKKK